MKSILIIEDDLPIAKMIRTYISFAGYEASIAPDGERALLMLGEEKYNLVILDLMLPYSWISLLLWYLPNQIW